MKTGLWLAIVVTTCVLGFVLGYGISSRTGVEPGYFEAAEAGSYGATTASSTEGVTSEDEAYYKSLVTDE